MAATCNLPSKRRENAPPCQSILDMKSVTVEVPLPWDERLTSLLSNEKFLAIVAMPLVLGVLAFLYSRLVGPPVPELDVEITEMEASDKLDVEKYTKSKDKKGKIPCYDPGTMDFLGYMPAMGRKEVEAIIADAKEAQAEWKNSTFEQRKQLLRIWLKYIIDHQEVICRVASRDSGKPLVDAAFGEVIVTCEKLRWLIEEGEQWLLPEKRTAGSMMFYKKARVEYHPYGVIGAIVPWNYPFHNVFNPLSAAVFAGNAIVIKVSEHASWSTQYYGRIIKEGLKAAGAPENLVQIVTGYGEAGNALVTGGVDKVIFVGSTQIGKRVMEAAADKLIPVVLELGGKDAFIVCDDADLNQAFPTALRGAFQSCGQNCAGAERFIVHAKVYDQFVARAAEAVNKLRQGPATGHGTLDCGAMCMPGLAEKVHGLVQAAVKDGARLLAGGQLPDQSEGQFYPPTLLVDVTDDMEIMHEEIFGPVMVISRFETDEEAIAIANNCPFGLGSSVFSRNQRRANEIASKLQAGMSSINDFATTYMCQSLPFGGVKESGFDRFAGIEGLRGMCVPKAVCEDIVPWLIRTDIPPPLQYPVADVAFPFVTSIVKMFYGLSWTAKAQGLWNVALCFLAPSLVTSRAKKD